MLNATNLAAWQPVISLAKDVVTLIAAILGIWIAFLGLRTWRRQLRGKTDYELARRLLRAVYKVRVAVNQVRNPMITAKEFDDALKKEGIETNDPQVQITREAAVYNSRWGKLADSFSEYQAELLEAEVSWGNEIVQAVQPLETCMKELYQAVRKHLRQFSQYRRQMAPDKMEEIDDILYEGATESDANKFETKLKDSILRIESFLKPHLRL